MMLERLLPSARKVEVNTIELAAPPAVVWEHVRHGDLADSPFVRALFAPSERLHVAWIRPVHPLMQTAQLRHLAARVAAAGGRRPDAAEGRLGTMKKDGDA